MIEQLSKGLSGSTGMELMIQLKNLLIWNQSMLFSEDNVEHKNSFSELNVYYELNSVVSEAPHLQTYFPVSYTKFDARKTKIDSSEHSISLVVKLLHANKAINSVIINQYDFNTKKLEGNTDQLDYLIQAEMMNMMLFNPNFIEIILSISK